MFSSNGCSSPYGCLTSDEIWSIPVTFPIYLMGFMAAVGWMGLALFGEWRGCVCRWCGHTTVCSCSHAAFYVLCAASHYMTARVHHMHMTSHALTCTRWRRSHLLPPRSPRCLRDTSPSHLYTRLFRTTTAVGRTLRNIDTSGTEAEGGTDGW